MGPSFMMILLALLGGGGNDLLDFIPTQNYWQMQGVVLTAEAMIGQLKPAEVGDVSELIKQLGADKFQDRDEASRKLLAMGPGVIPQLQPATKSKDVEVVTRARNIIARLSGKGQGHAVRRLMAIRALGELKDKQALPALKGLAKSKALFEAEYAAAAIAAIEGKPFKRPGVSAKAMASDLWLLPKSVGLVAQATLPAGGDPITSKELAKAISSVAGVAGPNAKADPQMAKRITEQLMKTLVMAAERVGNVRLHGASMALAERVDNDSGYVAFVIRGLYDPAAVAAVLTAEGAEVEKSGKTDIYWPDREFGMALPSSDRLVIVGGPRQNAAELKAVIGAMVAGKGRLKENAEMVKLVKSMGEGNLAWCVTRMTEAYRKEAALLKAFQTITGVIRQKDEQLNITVKAQGTDVEGAAAAVQEIQTGLAEMRESLAKAARRMPTFKPVSELLQSVKVSADGGNATLTGNVKGNFRNMLVAPFGMFIGVRSVHRAEAVGEAVEARPR